MNRIITFGLFSAALGGIGVAFWPTRPHAGPVQVPRAAASDGRLSSGDASVSSESPVADVATKVGVSGSETQPRGATKEGPNALNASVASEDPPAAPAAGVVLALPAEDEETDYEAIGRAQLERGDLEAALTAFRRHLAHHEPDQEILVTIGSLAHRLRDSKLAERALAEAIDRDGRAAEPEVVLARVYLETGRLTLARRHAARAAELDPDNGLAWNVAGRVALERRQWSLAESLFRRAAAVEPTSGIVHNNLGLLYVLSRRPKDAVASLETAIELFGDSTPSFTYNNLGLAYEQLGDLDDARDAFEEALVREPTYVRARVNLDRVLVAIEAGQVQHRFETAKSVAPDAPPAPTVEDRALEPESEDPAPAPAAAPLSGPQAALDPSAAGRSE